MIDRTNSKTAWQASFPLSQDNRTKNNKLLTLAVNTSCYHYGYQAQAKNNKKIGSYNRSRVSVPKTDIKRSKALRFLLILLLAKPTILPANRDHSPSFPAMCM